MNIDFPLESVTVEVTREDADALSNPRLSRPHLQVDENDFFLKVHKVAGYRVRNGHQLQIHPHKDADESDVNLFLNGSVLGAVLHQRAILPFHGSSFAYEGKGVIICGISGVGKSAVTAAFCQNGGRLINDDITPVRINKEDVTILPIKTRIKLWDDSLQKLGIKNNGFEKIRPSLDKFYLPTAEVIPEEQILNHLIVLSTHNKEEFAVNEPDGMGKYNVLRNQIYRRSYLKGMPATARSYFRQLFQLAAQVRVTQIVRPKICNIYDAMERIRKEMVR